MHEILRARDEGGPFTSITDFCERVDLRKVNRRSLESVIKVGAFDAFGVREQLVEAIDAMQAFSRGVWEAKDVGQGSLFELLGDVGESASHHNLQLPSKYKPLSAKEKLAWEKDLLGVYVSSHPLLQVSVDYQHAISAVCSDITPARKGRTVSILGMVASIRTINTKKGDRMAFMTVEDMNSSCDITIFPKTYEKTRRLLEAGRIILVQGKVDVRNERASIIAESITNELPVRADSIQPSAEVLKETGTILDVHTPADNALDFIEEDEPGGVSAMNRNWTPTYRQSEKPTTAPPANGNGHNTSVSSPSAKPLRTLHIRFALTEDPQLDASRLDDVMALVEKFSGDDPFTMTVFTAHEDMKLIFPERRARYCPEFVEGLRRLLGHDSLTVIR
ncbi:MAG: hypothetical protein DSY55_04500 [Clostridia bacterium]|nr:MAG: hypothetical protein DSY55_04500 [Clostridia bacterium]